MLGEQNRPALVRTHQSRCRAVRVGHRQRAYVSAFTKLRLVALAAIATPSDAITENDVPGSRHVRRYESRRSRKIASRMEAPERPAIRPRRLPHPVSTMTLLGPSPSPLGHQPRHRGRRRDSRERPRYCGRTTYSGPSSAASVIDCAAAAHAGGTLLPKVRSPLCSPCGPRATPTNHEVHGAQVLARSIRHATGVPCSIAPRPPR